MSRQPSPVAVQPRRPLAARLADYKYTLTVSVILLAHICLVWLQHAVDLFTPTLILAMYFLGFLFVLARDSSRLARLILLVGVVALLMSLASLRFGAIVYRVAALICHAGFLLLLIVYTLWRLFRERLVSIDTIMAGVIVYLLMGGLWAQLYALVVLFDPGAIHIVGGLGAHPVLTFYYFSVTTMTTAGYGDVVPISDLARILAAYEALVGQVYLVVFIALLMGRHFANR